MGTLAFLALVAFVVIRFIRNILAEKNPIPVRIPDTRDFGRKIRNVKGE